MSNNPDLSTITEKFVRRIWNLDEHGKFPKEADIHSTLVFEPNKIIVKSVAFSSKPLELEVYHDRVELPWTNPPFKAYAADPQYFDWVLAALQHLMLFSSMGWDSSNKVGEYTMKRVQDLRNAGYKSLSAVLDSEVQRPSRD